MPGTERCGIHTAVTREGMCQAAPLAIESMVRELVRTVSPDWSTVRLEIRAGMYQTWEIRLSGDGVRRG